MATQSTKQESVTIIGGGIAGLTLALVLHSHNIVSTIYELRSRSARTSGALMLSPNSLRLLDSIGIYSMIRPGGFEFTSVAYTNAEHVTVDEQEFGSKATYGYDGLRLYRQILLDALRSKVEEKGIVVHYERKFDSVIEESEHNVTIRFADGERITIDLLIGADGIHSKVRRVAVQDVSAEFIGLMALCGVVPTDDVDWPKRDDKAHHEGVPFALPASLHEAKGAFVIAPQDPEGKECLIGIQVKQEDLGRGGFEELGRNKKKLLELMQKDQDQWSPLVKSAKQAAIEHSMYIWPFQIMPKLDTWASRKQRVVILGDAAHAVPPTTGQGAGQAFEDAFSLAHLIVTRGSKTESTQGRKQWLEGLKKWQSYRQERVDRVLALTAEINNRRDPSWKPDEAASADIEVDWLFGLDVAADIQRVLA